MHTTELPRMQARMQCGSRVCYKESPIDWEGVTGEARHLTACPVEEVHLIRGVALAANAVDQAGALHKKVSQPTHPFPAIACKRLPSIRLVHIQVRKISLDAELKADQP